MIRVRDCENDLAEFNSTSSWDTTADLIADIQRHVENNYSMDYYPYTIKGIVGKTEVKLHTITPKDVANLFSY